MNNYIPYNPISIKNNFYPYYLYNQNNNKYPLQSLNVKEQKTPNVNKSEIYHIYNKNFQNINSNINTNYEQKNKNDSLQDQILSPNIEDSRPSFPAPIYYDDTRYINFLNYNYNRRYHQSNQNQNISNQIHNSSLQNLSNYNNDKKTILDIKENKKINFNKKMLILDLDETLVHSCFKPTDNNNNNIIKPDILLKIKFHSKYHDVLVYKRPFVEEFLERMNQYYNLIIFTASVQEYADPLLDQLDKNRYIKLRYYRNSCLLDKNGKFVKNLSTIYNDLRNVILLDNNPISYSYNKSNGLPIITWHFDKKDRELLKVIPVLEFLSTVNDIRNYLPRFIEFDMVNFTKFSILLDEINKEKEQNKYLKNRPKSSKHMQISQKEIPSTQNINNNFNKNMNKKEMPLNTKENMVIERNKNGEIIQQNVKFSTINNSSSKKNKEYIDINKSMAVKKNDFRNSHKLKNLKEEMYKKHKKRGKHYKGKINNLFNKDNKNQKMHDNKLEQIYDDENKSRDYLLKENKMKKQENNIFVIVNDKQQKNNLDNQNNQGNNHMAISNNPNDNIKMKNNPFIMKSADRIENKKHSYFSGLKNENENDRNKNIQINIINNIQQINLFKNEFDLKNDNIKKIDIINYYKNNSEKKAKKLNNTYFDNKIRKQNYTRNQSYAKSNDSQKIINKTANDDTNNIQKYYYNTAQNFYKGKNNLSNNNKNNNNNELKKEKLNEMKNENINNINKNTNNNFNIDKNDSLDANMNNINRYNMFNNYNFNNNIANREKFNQINNEINNIQKLLQHASDKRTPSYDDSNHSYRPWDINHIENSNYNNFYHRNSHYGYLNNLNNIHPYYFSNNYNNNNMDYRYDYNNNYIYKGQQRIYY